VCACAAVQCADNISLLPGQLSRVASRAAPGARSFVSRSRQRLGGGHDKHGDHAHHEHFVFEPPYTQGPGGLIPSTSVVTCVRGGRRWRRRVFVAFVEGWSRCAPWLSGVALACLEHGKLICSCSVTCSVCVDTVWALCKPFAAFVVRFSNVASVGGVCLWTPVVHCVVF
jgi:hypothetical protein